MKNKKVLIKGLLLVVCCLLLVIMAGASWGAVTLDEVAKELTGLKVEMAGIKSNLENVKESLKGNIESLKTIMVTLFVALFAAMAGLFYFVLDISRSLRIPKEERVLKLEEEIGKIKEFLARVAEKTHIPRVLLLLIVSCSLLVSLIALPSLAAVPDKINIQGVLTKQDGTPWANLQAKPVDFYLYDAFKSGNKVWSQQNGTVATDANGYFNAELDLSTGYEGTYTQGKAFADKLFLEIIIDGTTTLAPRQPLLAAPYAITAKTAKNVRGGTVRASGEVAVLAVSSSSNGGESGDYAIGGVSFSNVDAVRGANLGNGVGVRGVSVNGTGVSGKAPNFGGIFEATAQNGQGVVGKATGSGGYGVTGMASKDNGKAVYGEANGLSAVGVYGKTTGINGKAVYGEATGKNGFGVYGEATGNNSSAGYFNGTVFGVYSEAPTNYFSGKVGIGTTDTNYYRLHVESPTVPTVYAHSTGSWGVIGASDASFPKAGIYGNNTNNTVNGGIGVHGRSVKGYGGYFISLNSAKSLKVMGDANVTGKIGIGTTENPPTKLAVAELTGGGAFNLRYNTTTGGIYYGVSSRRYKDNIQLFSDDFSKILSARPRSFTWKTSGARDIGYIAEEFDELGLKDLVIYKDNQPESLKYDRIPLYILEVVKDQQKEIESLKQRIAELEKR